MNGMMAVLPEELTEALKAAPITLTVFEALPTSHRRQQADWVASCRTIHGRRALAADVMACCAPTPSAGGETSSDAASAPRL